MSWLRRIYNTSSIFSSSPAELASPSPATAPYSYMDFLFWEIIALFAPYRQFHRQMFFKATFKANKTSRPTFSNFRHFFNFWRSIPPVGHIGPNNIGPWQVCHQELRTWPAVLLRPSTPISCRHLLGPSLAASFVPGSAYVCLWQCRHLLGPSLAASFVPGSA